MTPNSPPMTPTSLSLRSGRGWWWGLGGMVEGEGDGRVKLEPCIGCGRMILIHRVANLTVRCEPTPMDGQGVAQELGAGRQIWTPEFGPGLIPKGLRGARPGDAKLLREHRCAAVSGPGTPPAVPAPPKGPQSPSGRRVAPSTRSSGPRTDHSSARPAVSPRFDQGGPRCDECGLIMEEGEYVSAQLGEIYIWAQHLTNCGFPDGVAKPLGG